MVIRRMPRNPIVHTLVDNEAEKVYQLVGYFPVLQQFVDDLNDKCIDDSKVLHGIKRFTLMNLHEITVDHAVPHADDNPTKWMHQQAKDFLTANPRMQFRAVITKMDRGDRKPIGVLYINGRWQLSIPDVAIGTNNVLNNFVKSTRLSRGQVEEYLHEWAEIELGKEFADRIFAPYVEDDDEDEEDEEF